MLESACSHADFFACTSALRSSRPASPARGESSARIFRATRAASPQIPTAIGFTRPTRSGLMSTWITFASRRPVVDAVAGQRGERIEPRAEREHHVGAGDQLHRRLRSVVAERPDGEPVRARKAVVVLVAVAHRRVEPLGERDEVGNGVGEHDARARQDDREFRPESSAAASPTASRLPPAARVRSMAAARCR